MNYQSFVPPVLPNKKAQVSRSSQLKKVHVALEVMVGTSYEKISRTLPDMGPFNMIDPTLAVEYFESSDSVMKDESDSSGKVGNYWDALEDSLEKMIKQENPDEGGSTTEGFSLDSLRTLLSRLEAWNDRAMRATLGTGQVLCSEVDELLAEARIISQKVDRPREVVTKLRILERAGQAFAEKVRAKLTLKGKEKVSLRMLTDFMKEAEALPIETEEVRFFRNQRGRIQAICHSAQKATKDKSLEKSKDVTIEAAEVRAILPDLAFLKEQVSIGEWVQKALNKTDKKGSVSIQVIEQLFDDPSAALIKPEECEVMRNLKDSLDQAHAWQSKATKSLAGIPTSSDKSAPKKFPTIEDLQKLLEDHASLPKVFVPQVSGTIEGIIRRAKAWIKKQERTLSGTWSLSDAKNLLEEGVLISQQADLNPELSNLQQEVSEAENWCVNARQLIANLSLTEIDQIDSLVSSSFKAPTPDSGAELTTITGLVSSDSVSADLTGSAMQDEASEPQPKRMKQLSVTDISTSFDAAKFLTRLNLSGPKELAALRNYESSLADLMQTLIRVQTNVVPLLESGRLPTQEELETLKESLGIVRDLKLEDEIVQLYDGASKWSDRAATVIAVPFPRPAGVLRSLATLIHDLSSSPMRYRSWAEVIQVAMEEVWAHELRYIPLPLNETRLDHLLKSCPVVSDVEMSENDYSCTLDAARQREDEIAGVLDDKQIQWMRDTLGVPGGRTRDTDEAGMVIASELALLEETEKIRKVYVSVCDDLLTPRRVPMHTRGDAEIFLSKLRTSKLLHLPTLIDRVQLALNKNAALESSSTALLSKLERDFDACKASKSSTDTPPSRDSLFHELLVLLESVEFAELRVEHFDSKFTPLVGKLLEYQSAVRNEFKWDHDEVVSELNFRPSLSEVESMWTKISSEAEQAFKLSQWFLQDVAYLHSAHRHLQDAIEWRKDLHGLIAELRNGVNDKLVSRPAISLLKKHVSRWSGLAIEVPYQDIITNAEMEAIDNWTRDVQTVVNNRIRSRRRASIEESESLLEIAKNLPICFHSAEFELLASQIESARELRNLSIATIKQSYGERISLVNPTYDPVAAATVAATASDMDAVSVELLRLLKESRKSPIRTGSEIFVEMESRIRSINKTLVKVLTRPQVVPAESVDLFVEAIQAGIPMPQVSTDGADESTVEANVLQLIHGVDFEPTKSLIDATREKLVLTGRWKRIAGEYTCIIPAHHVNSPAVTTGGPNGREGRRNTNTANSSGSATPTSAEQMNSISLLSSVAAIENSINLALNAPPTAAGEKILDIVLRNIDKEIVQKHLTEIHSLSSISHHAADVAPPDYVYPLPLYQLPVSIPPPRPGTAAGMAAAAVSTEQLAGSGRRTKTGSKAQSAAPTTPLAENPLLRKNLSATQQLLFQIPWSRPSQGYLSPLNEILMDRPLDWLLAEKESLKSRISKPGPTLLAALEILLHHRRGGLFQTSEYTRIRNLSAQSLKTVRNCVGRFPFLLPKFNDPSMTADIPAEIWEKYVLPSTHPLASGPSACLLYTSPSPRDRQKSRMPSSA